MIFNMIQGQKLDLIFQPEKIQPLFPGIPNLSEFIWVCAVNPSVSNIHFSDLKTSFYQILLCDQLKLFSLL